MRKLITMTYIPLLCMLLLGNVCQCFFNNSCLLQNLNRANKPSKDFDCCSFVISSTDEIWNGNRSESSVATLLLKYMIEDWESVTVFGQYLRGFNTLKKLVFTTLRAFPDIKLHIVDCFCEGNDEDGYKTTMPVIHTATHLGYHPIFGPPTGKHAIWAGIPNSFIKKYPDGWKYTAEWNIPDAWSLYQQLGVNPPHPKENPLKTSDCEQIFDWDTGKLNKNLIPDGQNIQFESFR